MHLRRSVCAARGLEQDAGRLISPLVPIGELEWVGARVSTRRVLRLELRRRDGNQVLRRGGLLLLGGDTSSGLVQGQLVLLVGVKRVV